jgi:flagellar hook protein FlgE
MYANALNGGGGMNVGIGVRLAAVSQQFTQGNITSTSNPMDLAINGGGFFQLTDGKNPTTYSRNGQFKVDSTGHIVNNDGLQLLGYAADNTGTIQPGQAVPLQLPTAGINPSRTNKIGMEFNVDARASATNPVTVATDALNKATTNKANADAALVTAQNAKDAADTAKADADAALLADPSNAVLQQAAADAASTVLTTTSALTQANNAANTAATALAQANTALATANAGSKIDFANPNTYNKATSLTVYDAKGQTVALNYYFQKAGTDLWNVYVTANGSTIMGSATDPQPVSTLAFDATGANPNPPSIAIDVPTTTTSSGSDTLPITGIALSFVGSTQYGSDFSVTNLAQDGYAPGSLTSIVVESSGIITARYSNGQSKPAGQVELATFRNMQGLQPIGGNGWQRTFASGDPIVGTPGVGNLGSLQAGALEESNVDLTAELVNMITAQRNYQANAQTIKTLDQTMQTLVNLR